MKALLCIAAAIIPLITHAQKQVRSDNGNYVVYVNQDYKPRIYSKLLIIIPSYDREINDKVLQLFVKEGIAGITSMDALPPTKEYTEDDVKQIAKKLNADGIIRYEITDKNSVASAWGPAITNIKNNVKVTMLDEQNNLVAATFIGDATSAATNPDKAVFKFFKAMMPELKPVMNR